MNVLCVSAHPDDELLGVGGTLAAHALAGDKVFVLLVCEGISSRYAPERHQEVQAQARRAARILGVDTLWMRDLPDQRLDTRALVEVTKEVDQAVTECRPERVYTHFAGDLNRDHRAVAEATLVATRPYSAPSVREVLMFETPSSTEWATPALVPAFTPNVFVDIGPTLERKLEAFACYTAELREPPHPRSLEALRVRARHWGSVSGTSAAEAFSLVRSVR